MEEAVGGQGQGQGQGGVSEMAGLVAQAVHSTLDPSIPHAVRLTSYTMLEKVSKIHKERRERENFNLHFL